MPQPSPRTKPSAALVERLAPAVARHHVRRDSAIEISGDSSMFTPPARAIIHSPARKAWQAMCTATSDDEQDVSIARFGPSRLRT